MTGTGIYATKEQLEELKEAGERAQNTPGFCLSSKQGIEGKDFASQAHLSAQELCYKYALENGLPEIRGFYGIKRDGEFVTI